MSTQLRTYRHILFDLLDAPEIDGMIHRRTYLIIFGQTPQIGSLHLKQVMDRRLANAHHDTQRMSLFSRSLARFKCSEIDLTMHKIVVLVGSLVVWWLWVFPPISSSSHLAPLSLFLLFFFVVSR